MLSNHWPEHVCYVVHKIGLLIFLLVLSRRAKYVDRKIHFGALGRRLRTERHRQEIAVTSIFTYLFLS